MDKNPLTRGSIAKGILLFSGISITVLGVIAIIIDKKNTLPILNVILPVFATWVGTIIAFYFGKENFESANEQVRQLVGEVRSKHESKSIMIAIRTIDNMTIYEIPKNKTDKDIKISDFKGLFTGNVSRLPILTEGKSPKYMIHESILTKYIVEGGKDTDSLSDLVSKNKNVVLEKGFILVEEQTTVQSAKKRLDDATPCQDIFVTKNGSTNDQLIGWVSNVRLSRFLKA